MKRLAVVLSWFVFACMASDLRSQDVQSKVAETLAKVDSVTEAGPFKPAWESLESYEVPQWYKDAKFGVFIHWGPYSVPAFGSEWYPRMMYIDQGRRGENMFEHHLKTYGPHKEFGYKDFIPMFKAEKFDATEWAKLFKEAGFRYVVPVAEHHDVSPCSIARSPSGMHQKWVPNAMSSQNFAKR